jgi:ferric-dicitrate binding protein FerR (iron transport regulator)
MKSSVLVAAGLIALPGIGLAQSVCDPAPAKAVSVQGSVEARRAGASDWQAVRLNDTFCPGDAIRVQERSRADIALLDQSVLRLNAGSTITVEAPKERTTGVVDLVRGAVHFFSRGPRSLEVNTPFTVVGVRGTEFLISLEPERTLLTVFEGTVVAENPAGSLTLRDGQSALAEKGKPPVPRVVVRPRDAVHWALYYPPVIHSPQAPGYQAQGRCSRWARWTKRARRSTVRSRQRPTTPMR